MRQSSDLFQMATFAAALMLGLSGGAVSQPIVSNPTNGQVFHIGDSMSIDWVYQGDARDVILKFSPDNGLTFFLVTQAGFSPGTPEYGHFTWVIPDSVRSSKARDATATPAGVVSVVNYQQQGIHGDVVISIQPDGIADPLAQSGRGAPLRMRRNGNVVTVTTPFSSSSDLSAAIFDASGRVPPQTQVRSMFVNDSRSITWDAAGRSHGMYILRLVNTEVDRNQTTALPFILH